MITNQEKAQAYYTAVNRYDVALIEKMVDEEYIQHNPRVPTGRAAFVALFPRLKEHGTQIQNLRLFQDGPYVIMHHLWTNAAPFGADEKVAFHIIRFADNGLIAEHWSVMTDPAKPNPSGRTLIDGPTKTENLHESERNKQLVRELFARLTRGESKYFEKELAPFFAPDFRQHHPEIGDGLTAFSAALRRGDLLPVYRRQHRIFGAGCFVLSISEGILNGRPTALYDLFRLEKGQIVEQWMVYQEIPSEGVANRNTMFGF